MGQFTEHKPVVLIVAVTSRNLAAFDWSAARAEEMWGPMVKRSRLFNFTETQYYEKSMGQDLKKQFLAFENLIDPAAIADTKHISNDWESQYAGENSFPESRPVNIDPGYISEAKLVLVTTKDRDHRIYLREGIFAEVTLHFRGRGWTHARWTYPDYQRADFQEFFTDCRTWLRQRHRTG